MNDDIKQLENWETLRAVLDSDRAMFGVSPISDSQMDRIKTALGTPKVLAIQWKRYEAERTGQRCEYGQLPSSCAGGFGTNRCEICPMALGRIAFESHFAALPTPTVKHCPTCKCNAQ